GARERPALQVPWRSRLGEVAIHPGGVRHAAPSAPRAHMRASIAALVMLAGCASGMSALDRGLALARAGRDAEALAALDDAVARALAGDADGARADWSQAIVQELNLSERQALGLHTALTPRAPVAPPPPAPAPAPGPPAVESSQAPGPPAAVAPPPEPAPPPA